MKSFFNLLGIAVAGILGYMAEPGLRFRLTGSSPSPVEIARDANVVLQMPGGASPIDLASLSPEQLPAKVLLNADVKVADAATGITMILQAGNRVKLVRIEGGNAVVSPGDGSFLGSVPVTSTDLLQQIAANPPVAAVPVAVTPTTGESEEPVAMPEAPPVPEPAPAPEPAAPAPEPAAPAEPAASAGPTDAVKAMQDSIRAAQIKEFGFAQVLTWKAEPDETVDGESYQTGLASYKAETIFGVKTIQAKALIKGGKVQRWIWPKSGMEIK